MFMRRYLDRHFIPQHPQLVTTEVQLMRVFEQAVFVPAQSGLMGAIIEIIDAERDGQHIDRALVKHCADIFVRMGLGAEGAKNLAVYESGFQEPLLRASAAFFERKSSEWLERDSMPVYLVRAEDALAAEAARVQACMDESTEPRLLRVLR